jgi:homoserine kinase type II
MAVYTVLSDDFVRAMVAVYPEVNGPPPGHAVVEVTGMPQGSINTTYRVRMANDATWFLRVNEGKSFARLVRERDLLAALATKQLGLVTPRMATSVAGSVFFAVDGDDGVRRWASLFAGLPGREIGGFEVTPAHAQQVGSFLARFHGAMRRFRGGPNPYGHRVVDGWFPRLLAFDGTRAAALRLQATLHDVVARRRPLPRGLIHGDLFIDNTRWSPTSTLVAAFDWEMAGRDALALDLAITLCAWAFRREDGVMTLREDVAQALVDGYQRVRRLRPSERRGFFGELRLAAVRFAASRMVDFALPRSAASTAERRYLDPADFIARLDLLEGHGDRGLRRRLELSEGASR